MSWADTEAVVALIESVPVLADSTFVTELDKLTEGQPPQPLPYCLVHPSDGIDTAERESGPPITTHPEFTLHIVGASANQVQVIVDLLKAVLVPSGVPIVVAVSGRINDRLRWAMPLPIQIATELVPPLCYAVLEVGWRSNPA